jgi:hypothetical protein
VSRRPNSETGACPDRLGLVLVVLVLVVVVCAAAHAGIHFQECRYGRGGDGCVADCVAPGPRTRTAVDARAATAGRALASCDEN